MSEHLRLPDGREINAGDFYQDARRPIPRLMRVESISDVPWEDWKGHKHYLVMLAVVRREPSGGITVLRGTVIEAEALLDISDYVCVDAGVGDQG